MSARILAPHQSAEVQDLLKQEHGKVKPASRPLIGASLSTEKDLATQSAIGARRDGAALLRELRATFQEGMDRTAVEDDMQVIDLVDCVLDMCVDALDFSQLKIMGEFDDTNLQASTDMEDGLYTCQEVTEHNAVQISVVGALNGMMGWEVKAELTDSESDVECVPTLQPSTKTY